MTNEHPKCSLNTETPMREGQMKKMIFAAILIEVLATPLQAQTLAKTAGDMAQVCADLDEKAATRNPALALKAGFCLGYFQGVLISNVMFTAHKRGDAFFCAPIEVTPEQARKVFLKYLNDHPEQLHENPNSIAVSSLIAAFPCGRNTK